MKDQNSSAYSSTFVSMLGNYCSVGEKHFTRTTHLRTCSPSEDSD